MMKHVEKLKSYAVCARINQLVTFPVMLRSHHIEWIQIDGSWWIYGVHNCSATTEKKDILKKKKKHKWL